MNPYFTGKGDDGTSGLLGEGRVSKSDLRLETVGTLDEASAVLGLSRSLMTSSRLAAMLTQIQRDLYLLMAEVSASPENETRFQNLGVEQVRWLEEQIERVGQGIKMPEEFIVPGDTLSSGAMSLARTIVRRAERRLVQLSESGMFANPQGLAYLNRLSSLCFVLELHEIKAGRAGAPTLVKRTSI